MAASYLSLESLAPALATNAPVLVPNNRLRNHLLRAYALQQTAKAWLKPNILSLSQWLEIQWESLQNKGVAYSCVNLATNLQRQIIWESAIRNSALGATLLQPKSLAQQADSAYKNLELWRLDSNFTSDYFTDSSSNSAQFAGWIGDFRKALQLQNTITREHSYALIANAFTHGDLARLPVIYLEGFDDLPPVIEHLLGSATEKLVRLPAQSAHSPNIIRTQAANLDEEMRAAARWSKARLAEAPDTALIGIVVPNLGQCRDKIERIFTEIFEPAALLPSSQRYTLPFNFSAGTPLGSRPLIASLFDILDLQQGDWPLERLCNLLHSPFWGDADRELVARTYLSSNLRELKRIRLTTADLRFQASKLEQRQPLLADAGLCLRFEKLGTLLRRHMGNRSAREWLEIFDQVLTIMGWPGSRRLDSQEYQQLNQWFELRDQFITLDNFSAPISYRQACKYLRELADKTPFQAQTPDSPIQILGALEAAGLQFSHLWVMGLSDDQWPPVPAPNPLLPLELQRQQLMPHASAERELEIAERLTERYRQSAPLVVFSSAHSDGDTELRPSALIRSLPETPIATLLADQASGLDSHYQALLASADLELVADACGPRLAPGEQVRGGSNLFKLQAVCPFSAFAVLRLGARNPDEPVFGFSPAERGNLLHDALAAIWKHLGNSTQLRALGNESLTALVDSVTEDLIRQAQSRDPRQLGKVYCELEQERLSGLLCEWLQQEASRPDFTVVAVEEQHDIEFAGLPLSIRIDRVDEFTNGERLLIDYKTGSASSKDWLGERPVEPQLPLYAVTAEADTPVSAISFAIINRKEMAWDGLGALNGDSARQPSLKLAEDWASQLREWQATLQRLAEDFINGDARVDFVDKKQESYAADLLPLNRLADTEALANFLQGTSDKAVGGAE